MSLRPAIPRRVGLHQSPPPLHQPRTMLEQKRLWGERKTIERRVSLSRLSQRRGSPQCRVAIRGDIDSRSGARSQRAASRLLSTPGAVRLLQSQQLTDTNVGRQAEISGHNDPSHRFHTHSSACVPMPNPQNDQTDPIPPNPGEINCGARILACRVAIRGDIDSRSGARSQRAASRFLSTSGAVRPCVSRVRKAGSRAKLYNASWQRTSFRS